MIGLNSIQLAAVYAQIEISWPRLVNVVLESFSLAAFNFELVSPECSIHARNPFFVKCV